MLPADVQEAAEEMLFNMYIECNDKPMCQVLSELRAANPLFGSLSRDWLSRTLKKYGWSFKKATLKQRLKFTSDNIECVFCALCVSPRAADRATAQMDAHLHESDRATARGPSQVSRRVGVCEPRCAAATVCVCVSSRRVKSSHCIELHRQRAVGPRGMPAVVVNGDSLAEHYVVPIIVGLRAPGSPMPTVYANYRDNGMNMADFFNFVVAAVNDSFLVRGDYLICDDAILKAPFIMLELEAFLQQHGVEIHFLPTYSPELNPCELVFGQVKRDIWASRNSARSFRDEINDRFAAVTQERLFAYYEKCLNFYCE